MKGRAFAAVVLSALLLLSGLGIGGWWLLWQRGPLQLAHQPLTMPRAARFVPASASFSLYLFSDGQRPVDYARAVAPARQRRPAGEAIARLRDGAFAAAGLDYQDELAAWLGGDIAMALLEDPVAAATGTPEQPAGGWLLALASRDDDGARRFLQRFWQTRSLAGTDLQVSRYRGMGLISGRGALLGSRPEPLATALVDDDLVLIASGRNLLERALDVSQIPELNQAGQPQLRQGIAAFSSGAALAVASPQALQSWLGLPSLEGLTAAPLAPASAGVGAAPPAPGVAPRATRMAAEASKADGMLPGKADADEAGSGVSREQRSDGAVPDAEIAGEAPSEEPGGGDAVSDPSATRAPGRRGSSSAGPSAGRSGLEQIRGDDGLSSDASAASGAAAGGSSRAQGSTPPGTGSSEPQASAPPSPGAAPSLPGSGPIDSSATDARATAPRATDVGATVPRAIDDTAGDASAARRSAADLSAGKLPSGPAGAGSGPTAAAPGSAAASGSAASGSAASDPSGATVSSAPVASNGGVSAAPAPATATPAPSRSASPEASPAEPASGLKRQTADPRRRNQPGAPASPPADAGLSSGQPPAPVALPRRAPWAAQPAIALAPAARPPAVATPPAPAAASLLAVLQPQGRELELRARLLLPQAPHLSPLQPRLGEALLAALRGSPSSLALIQDPAAFGQQPLLRPLLERSLGLRPAAAAERQGPLPGLLASSLHGPLLASLSAEGWQLASRAGDPAAADLEPLLRQAGLLEAPLELDGHSLRVWTHLSLPGRSSRRDRQGGDALLAPLAGWSEQSQDVARWGQTLVALEAPADSRALTALRRGLRELGLPQAPLQLSLDADTARALLRSWQPWRLLSALAGGGLDGSVQGLALALESPPEVSALELRARLNLGA